MKYRTSPYILEKDGVYYSFPSEKAACDFLGVPKSCVSSSYRHGGQYYGFNIIKPLSENDIYNNKRLRKIWESMHERCEYEKHPQYHNYGGRGISVCDEWSEYIPFAKWAFRNGYAEDLSIDRIDPDGMYEPNNCRWTTIQEQQRTHKRSLTELTFNNETKCLSEWARATGLHAKTIKYRLLRGWSVERTLTTPPLTGSYAKKQRNQALQN